MSQTTPIRLAAAGEACVTGRAQLRIAGEIMDFEITAPSGPASLEALLPIFQGLTDKVVSLGVARAAAAGEQVSCRAGCGACCRQAVPIAEPEARALARLVEAMPEPRRTEVRARFADALRRLEDLGLLNQARGVQQDEGGFGDFGARYLLSRIPCPFLEAESCSIHADRPLVCREYLVSSPPELCAFPVKEQLKPIPRQGQPSKALRQVGREQTPNGWVLLVEALDWAERHPPSEPVRTGPELVQAVFEHYARS